MRAAQPWRTNRARSLRSTGTSAEMQMWQQLRGRRFKGQKFIRQMPIGPFFADFACRTEKFIIEVDGGMHATPEEIERDRERSEFLARHGYRIYRGRNAEIYENIDGVMESISAYLDSDER